MSDEHDALVHAHDAVMVPGMDSTPGPANSGALDTKSTKKKKGGSRAMVKNSSASALSALAALGYRPSPVKTTPRKGSFVANLAAAATVAPLDVGGSLGGVGTPFASVGVQGTMALAADAAAAAVGVRSLQGPGMEGIGGASSGRRSEGDSRSGSVGSDHPSLTSQGGTKHHRRKRLGSVTFGGVGVAGGGAVPPLMLPSAPTSNDNITSNSKEYLPNLSISTKDKEGGVSNASTSLKLKRKPSASGSGLDEGLPPPQLGAISAMSKKSSKSMRNLFGGLMLRRMTSTKISNDNDNQPLLSGAEGEVKEVKGMWGLVRGQYVEVGGQGVRKNSLRAMANALGRRASGSIKSFGCVVV